MSALANYGFFNPSENTFTLTGEPPRKWRNIHYNQPGPEEIYAETSNLGDGPITVRDNAGCTCTLVGYDAKYLYIRDDETNLAFNPWGDPLPTPVSDKRCIFHPAFTRIESTCADLAVRQTVFVPADEPVEIWTAEVRNLANRPRTVSLFAYAMFQLTGSGPEGQWVGKDNHSRIHRELGAVIIHNRSREVPNGRFNGFLATPTLTHYVGATGYRDFFTTEAYSLAHPRLLHGWNADNRVFYGPDCAAALQVRFTLAPGQSARADFILGQTGDVAELATRLPRFSPSTIDALLADQIKNENRRASSFRVDTGNVDRDSLINCFAKKQMVSYLINKSGFRDNLQNDMGVVLFDWPMARANLLRAISSQYISGAVPHSFRPFNRHQYSDKPAWLLHCVPWCLKESGDLTFLDETVPYSDSDQSESVWHHMLRAMRFLAQDTGAHGLCDQHFADWNDGLEPSEKTGPRESVMVTQQLCLGLLEIAELARRRQEPEVEREAMDLHAHFTRLLNEVAWDGEWYVRTLTTSGYTLGSHQNAEGKIFLNTQSWAVLSRTAPEDRARSAMAAVDRLIETDHGFSIAAPAFTVFDERIGKFSASRPYYTENGGCYNHAAGFKGVADCLLGRAEEAWRTYLKVAPGSPWNPISNSCVEPFSFTNCYSLTEEWKGLALYPWRTGTCAWFTQLLVEWILGARRHYDGLLIDPCLSRTVSHAKVRRTFRGAIFDITLDNSAGRCRGLTSLTLNGQPVVGTILPPQPPGTTHQVHVII
ncbi:MAG: glycosyl transferase [Candidatus Methylacidiphilales bacterium]